MGLGSLGFAELAVIFIIVLVFFGPRRFPEIARSMGSAMREFRRSLNQIQRELEEVDPRKDIPGKDILDDLRSGKPGNWLDPKKSSTPPRETPGASSTPETAEPQVTGEAATAAESSTQAPPAQDIPQFSRDEGEQLPIFEGSAPEPESDVAESVLREPEPTEPEEAPTDDSRSG